MTTSHLNQTIELRSPRTTVVFQVNTAERDKTDWPIQFHCLFGVFLEAPCSIKAQRHFVTQLVAWSTIYILANSSALLLQSLFSTKSITSSFQLQQYSSKSSKDGGLEGVRAAVHDLLLLGAHAALHGAGHTCDASGSDRGAGGRCKGHWSGDSVLAHVRSAVRHIFLPVIHHRAVLRYH